MAALLSEPRHLRSKHRDNDLRFEVADGVEEKAGKDKCCSRGRDKRCFCKEWPGRYVDEMTRKLNGQCSHLRLFEPQPLQTDMLKPLSGVL